METIMMKLHCALPFTLALLSMTVFSGCATPEAQVRAGLANAGLSRPIAACMAERMVDRLSLLQLRRIGRLSDLRDANVRELSVDQFLHRARAIGDPEVVAVMSSSGAICAVQTRR
jgi:hypothetical protein